MPRADFITGIVLFLLGVFLVIQGAGMPGPAEVAFIEEGGEPGRVPIVVGCVLSFFAVILIVRAAGEGGHRLWPSATLSAQQRVGALRCLITIFGCSAYAVGLLGATIAGWKVPYEAATALFVFLFIVAFDWPDARDNGQVRWSRLAARHPGTASALRSIFGFVSVAQAPYLWLLVTALIQAVVVAAAVTYLFENEFFVTLP